MITVIDIKIGNIASVSRALKYLGIAHEVSDNLKAIKKSDKIIFPGVGNFSEAVSRLNSKGLDELLREMVIKKKIPILGICLGMQLFASFGEEGGGCCGLDFIKAKVSYHRAGNMGLRLPHIGWNDVSCNGFKIFEGINNKSCFYFIHSYEFIPEEPVETAHCTYGIDFLAAVQKDNIIGVQFHPEKSQEAGLKLLSNFCQGIF